PWAIDERARGSTSSVASEWLWISMKPGATTRPLMSMDCSASRPSRLPTETIRPAEMPMSAARGALPVPSTRVPPRRAMSSMRLAERGRCFLVDREVLAEDDAVLAPCVVRREFAVPHVARHVGRIALQRLAPAASAGGQVAEQITLLDLL